MKPGRYNTDGIIKRLETKGFIHESDLAWLEKRARKLGLDAQDAGEPAGEEHEKIHRAFEQLFTACNGEAHSNSFIDNCMMCAPRWGRVINRDKVLRNISPAQIELLGVVASANGLPMPLRAAEVDVAEKLRRHGLVDVEYRPLRNRATITDKGREHLRRIMGAV